MPKLSDIRVQFRGGMRGSHIDIKELIRKETVMDIISFEVCPSRVRNCERMCKMQIRIEGELHVTWHSSEVLTNFLVDCKEQEEKDGVVNYPIEGVVIYTGDDKSYMIKDGTIEI